MSAGKKYDAGKAPVTQGCLFYFPKALKAVSSVSDMGRRKYNLTFSDRNWYRVENGQQRYADAAGRHLLDSSPTVSDEALAHAAQAAWNALARLELMLEDYLPGALEAQLDIILKRELAELEAKKEEEKVVHPQQNLFLRPDTQERVPIVEAGDETVFLDDGSVWELVDGKYIHVDGPARREPQYAPEDTNVER